MLMPTLANFIIHTTVHAVMISISSRPLII